MLPFTADVLSALYESYNRAVWPAALVFWLAALAIAGLGLRSGRHGLTQRYNRVAGVVLAGAWVWVGIVFHLDFFAAINFWAPLFGALFLVQAVLIAWTWAYRGRALSGWPVDAAGWAGLALIAYAALGTPLIAATLGDGWASARLAGIAPGPTALLTLGLLMLTQDRVPLHLTIIPVLWCLVAGVTAWQLGVPEDRIVAVLALTAVVLIVRANTRRRPANTRRRRRG